MIINPYSFVSLDPDAQAFLNAAAITDPTISGAINTLVVQMKADNIWTKMKAIYPFVGGSPSSHSFDLITASSVITWNGGITHDSNGITTNGVNGFGITNINPSTIVPNFNTNSHLSIYNRKTVPSGNGFALGVGNTATGNPLYGLTISRAPDTGSPTHYDCGYISSNGRITYSEFPNGNNAKAFYIASAIASNDRKLYKNGNVIASTSLVASGTPPSAVMHIGKFNPTAGLDYFQGLNISFISSGLGLTSLEESLFRSAVQTFQTTLNRQV